ncbi:HU family DNA-binding protein [Desulfovibrio sp. OttesenSCG-928-C14]|nr:HU family DNA-binding protein [Desulfovibrio sp. OttesenSCG-928-C14]
MNSRELAKELKAKAKLKSVSAAERLLDDVVEIITQRLTAGENVTIARLGTFKAFRANPSENTDSPGMNPGITSKPVVTFKPYCAFASPNDEARVNDETKYRLIHCLPKIFDCLAQYQKYENKKSRQRGDTVDNFFNAKATDSDEQIKIKNLTRAIIAWMHNPALPDMNAEIGVEWEEELEVLCQVASRFITGEE